MLQIVSSLPQQTSRARFSSFARVKLIAPLSTISRLACCKASAAPFAMVIALTMISAGGVAEAATNTWKVASGNWGTAGNWTATPANTDDALFYDPALGAIAVTGTLDGNKTVNSLTFQSPGTTLLTGGASNRNLTINGSSGVTVLSGAGDVTISIATNTSGIIMGADQTWTNDANLSITNTVKPLTGPNTLTITGTTITGATNISGVISGSLSLVKSGSGSLTLSNASNDSYTGTTTVNAGTVVVSGPITATPSIALNGGELRLGVADRLPNTVAVTGSGGTLNTNGFNETVGTFTLASTATIDLGSGASILHFANSSGVTWMGSTLLITNWSGSPSGLGTDQLFFGNSTAGLASGQLSAVVFVNPLGFDPGSYAANILSTGELVPVAVPEPSTWATILGGIGFLVIFRRRQGAQS